MILYSGGGYDEAKDTIIIEAESYEYCIDELQWSDSSGDVTCTNFTKQNGYPDIDKCLTFGHFASDYGMNGTTACCNCRYGYDDVGGGYRGDLLGRLLRVYFIEDNNVDSIHYFNISNDILPSGVMYNFFRNFAVTHGLGAMKFGDSEKGTSLFSSKTCVEELVRSNVDVCIGM